MAQYVSKKFPQTSLCPFLNVPEMAYGCCDVNTACYLFQTWWLAKEVDLNTLWSYTVEV